MYIINDNKERGKKSTMILLEGALHTYVGDGTVFTNQIYQNIIGKQQFGKFSSNRGLNPPQNILVAVKAIVKVN